MLGAEIAGGKGGHALTSRVVSAATKNQAATWLNTESEATATAATAATATAATTTTAAAAAESPGSSEFTAPPRTAGSP